MVGKSQFLLSFPSYNEGMILTRVAVFFMCVTLLFVPHFSFAVDFQCMNGAAPIPCAIGAGVEQRCEEHCPAQQNEEVKPDTASQSDVSNTNNPNEGLECDTARFQGIAGASGGIGSAVKCWKAGIRGGERADRCVVKGITCQSLEQKAQEAMAGPKPTQGQPGAQSGEAPNTNNYQQQLEDYRNNYLKDEIAQQRADDAWYAQQSNQFRNQMSNLLNQAYLDNVTQGAQEMIRQSGSPRNLIGTLSEWANFNQMVNSGQIAPQQLFDYMGQQGLESYDLGMLQRNAPLSNTPGEQVFSGARNLIRPAGTFNNSGGANPFGLPTYTPQPVPVTGQSFGSRVANAWQNVRDTVSDYWDRTLAALTPTTEPLSDASLSDAPVLTPDQELPGITPEMLAPEGNGLPTTVDELAEQLESSAVAGEIRANYVEEILASRDGGWTPTQEQLDTARSIARENVQMARGALSDRNGFETWADQFVSVSGEQRALDAALAQEQALAQLNRDNFRSDAYLLQPDQAETAAQQGVTGTQSTPNPQLARRLETIGGIAEEARIAEQDYIAAMERAGLIACKSPCSNVNPQYEAVDGLSEAEQQRLRARVAPEREVFEASMAKYSDYEKATEQAFLEERRAAGATESTTAQTRAERAVQLELVGQRDALSIGADDVFTSTAVTEFGSSLVRGDGGVSTFEITPEAEQRVLSKLYAASDRNAIEYESCASNCGQIAEAMRRTEGYIEQIERGEYTDTGLRSLLVKESNQALGGFGQSFRETQASLGQAMSEAWSEAGDASSFGSKLGGYAKAVGYFATSLPGQLTGSALGQTSTDFGLELMTGYGYGGLTGSTGYQFLDIVEAGSAYAVPLTGVYTFASPVRALENGISSAISGTARLASDVASFAPGRTLSNITGNGFMGDVSALPAVRSSALPTSLSTPAPVSAFPAPSVSAPLRAANTMPAYVNAIARALNPSSPVGTSNVSAAPIIRSAINDVPRVTAQNGFDAVVAARLASALQGTPAGTAYSEAAQLGRQASTQYVVAENALRDAVNAPNSSPTSAQRALADLAEAETLRVAADARLTQADAILARESLSHPDEVVSSNVSGDASPLTRNEIYGAYENTVRELADRHGIAPDEDFITKHWVTDDIDSQVSAAKALRDIVGDSSDGLDLVRAAAGGDSGELLAEIGGRMGAPHYIQPKNNVGSSGGILNSIARPLRPLALGLSLILNPISPSSIPGLNALDNAIVSPSPAAASEASRRGMSAARQAPLLGQEREVVTSFYGDPGDPTAGSRVTSSGAIYDPVGLSIAHRDLRLGTRVLLDDGVHQPVVARVTNRGPFTKKNGVYTRDVDLSYEAAKHFETVEEGVARLKMTVLDNPPDSVAYSWVKGRTDLNDGQVITRESAQTLVAQAQSTPMAPQVRVAEAVPTNENVVVTPDEIVNRALVADHPARVPVGKPQLEAVNPLSEVDDFFGRIFTPTEQGVKDVVKQVIKESPYVPRAQLAAQVLKEQPSAAGTKAYGKLRDNAARELAGRRDGQGRVSATELARADEEITRQLAVLNGEVQPQRTLREIAKATGRPEIPGLEGKVYYLTPLMDPARANPRTAIVLHQTQGWDQNVPSQARSQLARPTKTGATIWVRQDGSSFWSAPENTNPAHIQRPRNLRGDNQYIDNSSTYGILSSNNTIGIEFAGNYPDLTTPLTPAQLRTAAYLVRFLQERYNIPSDRVYAHSWIQGKSEGLSNAGCIEYGYRPGCQYVEGAQAANVVRMLGYRPGIDAGTDFTSISDQALVNTAMANLPTGGPMDATVRTALRDAGDGILIADNAPTPGVPPNQFVETAFNRVSPFNVAPSESAEQVVRNFTTPSAFDEVPVNPVQEAPVLVSEVAPAARPTTPTQVALNDSRVVPSASEPRSFGVLDAVIEAPIALGNGISRAANALSDTGSRIRNLFEGPGATVRNAEDVVADVPLQGQVVASNEQGLLVRSPEVVELAPSQAARESLQPIAPAVLAESSPIAITRIPLSESEIVRPVTPTSVALGPSSRVGSELTVVSEQPIQIASKTVRVEDVGGADTTAVASANVQSTIARAEVAEQRAVAAKVFLAELDTSKRLADNVNRLMGAYFNRGQVLDPQSLSSAIQKSVTQVNRFERAITDAEAAGALDTVTAAQLRDLFAPVKNTSELLESQRPQLMRLVQNSHSKVSLGATFGVDGAAEGLQAIRTTPPRLRASLAERQALETAAREGAAKTIAAADTARAEAKLAAEAEELRLVEEARVIEARAAQIVNQRGVVVAYVEPATPGTWPSPRAGAVPQGPFEVSIARAPEIPSAPQNPTNLPGQDPGVPSGRTPTVARQEEIDPALTPPPIPRQDPELPFPENAGVVTSGEVSPSLTTDGGPIALRAETSNPSNGLRNWLNERLAEYRTNRIAAGTGPTQELASMSDSFVQRLSNWGEASASRAEQATELSAIRAATQARTDVARQNVVDISSEITDPQVPLPPNVRDTALTDARNQMDVAATRFAEANDDFARANEVFARNTLEGNEEARRLLESGRQKFVDAASAESQALALVRAADTPAADDMVAKLNQWGASHVGITGVSTPTERGSGSGGTGVSVTGASNDSGVYRAARSTIGFLCGGPRRATVCGLVGLGVGSAAYQGLQPDNDASTPSFSDVVRGTDIPGSIVQAPNQDARTPASGSAAETNTSTDSARGSTSEDSVSSGTGVNRDISDSGDGARDSLNTGGFGSGAGGPGSGGLGGFSRGGLSLLQGLFQGLFSFFGQNEEENSSQTPSQPEPQSPSQPTTIVGTIVANPPLIDAGATTTLSWSSVGTDVSSSTCAVITADFAVFHRGGQSGSIGSPTLSESTRFGLVCNTKSATGKLLHETLVRVRGDDTDPERIFTPEEIAASQTSSANGGGTPGSSAGSGGSGGSGGGQSGNPAPKDVRTCEPEQPINSFIRCLCEVEPDPAGCIVPAGGL